MKVRTGFVSNSSSTSFIVALPDEPCSPVDVKHMMFPDPKDDLKFCVRSGDDEKMVPVSQDMIAGFIYGRVEGNHGQYDMGWLPNLISTIEYTVHDKRYACETEDENGCWDTPGERCCEVCGIDPKCPEKWEYRSKENRGGNALRDIKHYRAAVDATKAFMEKYPGWHYYYVDTGCQTDFARFFNDRHGDIFKNIGFLHLGDL